MTELSTQPLNAAFAQIEDRLDTIGQKYRVQQLLRGCMLWLVVSLLATLACVLTAHVVGAGSGTRVLLGGWVAWLAGSAAFWIVRPFLIHPDALQVARLVESRVGGLHNGLTNSLLLARRPDLAASPWLPSIFSEVLSTAQSVPLNQAVRLGDLRGLTAILGLALLVGLTAGVVMRHPMLHGWQQLFNPTAFVPKTGEVRIVEVTPGDTRVVTNQALDLTVIAEAPRSFGQPGMKIIFDAPAAGAEEVDAGEIAVPLPAGGEKLPSDAADVSGNAQAVSLRYTWHIEHLGRSVRYRVEVAGTQSRWYSAEVIRKVQLSDLSFHITPPGYTGPATDVHIKPQEIGRSPIVAPLGSQVAISATVDVPVGGAMLQVGDAPTPVHMAPGLQGRRFATSFLLLKDTPLSVLLTDKLGQVMFKVPDDPLTIGCTNDAPPSVQMKWPVQDSAIPPDHELKVVAQLHDDYGLTWSRVRVLAGDPAAPSAGGASAELPVAVEQPYPAGTKDVELSFVVPLDSAHRKHGEVIRIQVEAADNRDLGPDVRSALAAQFRAAHDTRGDDAMALDALVGRQISTSAIYQIKLQDADQIVRDQREKSDALRQKLREMLETQKALHDRTAIAKAGDHGLFAAIGMGQTDLRVAMKRTAETFKFDPDDLVIQKALLMLYYEPAKEAVNFCALLSSEPDAAARRKQGDELMSGQRRIISTLEGLLAVLGRPVDPATQPTTRRSGDLLSKAQEMKKLDDALKQFMKEQQRILDQTATLAKKPVDNFDDADKKKLEELTMAQEKLDAFMQEKIHDFSKLAEQDMSNSSMLKDLYEIYSEVTMAKDALNKKASEMAVAAEDMGLELAKEQSSNIEKWLANAPDRTKWTQEDPTDKKDIPMPELPKELEDMVGKLLEQEEDLFDQIEDQNANWTDSADKGIGWDAADGPIADMSAKGVTGNTLPNNNEMGGRSGEGRSGKSQGEMVDDSAVGKGGRRTPTRLDPTPFQKGQVKDTSKDPTGGATGGGKLSGQGGQGLEGPVGPRLQQQMQRLAQKQAQLRNEAERLNLQYQLGRYDNFKLTEATAVMRRVESDLNANRYQNAMRRRDLTLDSLDTSRLLLGSEVHVERDTTPGSGEKVRKEINDAKAGEYPPAWSDALKKYYEKLSEE